MKVRFWRSVFVLFILFAPHTSTAKTCVDSIWIDSRSGFFRTGMLENFNSNVYLMSVPATNWVTKTFDPNPFLEKGDLISSSKKIYSTHSANNNMIMHSYEQDSELQDRISETKYRSKRNLTIFGNFGYFPFSATIGIGVCVATQCYLLLDRSSKFVPLVVTADVLSIGFKHYDTIEPSSAFYAFEAGPVWAPQFSYSSFRTEQKLSGGCIQCDYGYEYLSEVGFGASFSIGVTAISIDQHSPLVSPGVKGILSWSF